MSALPRGLYAVTPDEPDTARLVAKVRAALEGGACLLQYRNKTAPATLLHEQARAVSILCRAAGVPFIVNDDLALALAIDADGVHLGADDGDIATARAALGNGKLLGASCYNRFELALAARRSGADHVAFGAVFPSATKPGAVHADLGLFAQARALGLPAVAIGGITVENAARVIGAGAHAVAVISDLFDAPDVRARAVAFHGLFTATPVT